MSWVAEAVKEKKRGKARETIHPSGQRKKIEYYFGAPSLSFGTRANSRTHYVEIDIAFLVDPYPITEEMLLKLEEHASQFNDVVNDDDDDL